MSYIYFIQAQDNGPIKIGFTAGMPKRRMAFIQVGCPWPIKLLGAIEGSIAKEKQIHLVLRRFKTRGEWFEPHPIVIAAVKTALEIGVKVPVEGSSKDDDPDNQPLRDYNPNSENVSDLIEQLGGATALAVYLGIKSVTTVASWKERQSIPVIHWPALITAASKYDVALDYDRLVNLHLVA